MFKQNTLVLLVSVAIMYALKAGADCFNLGVGSGDPSDTGVSLWTRVNPYDYDKNEPVKVMVSKENDFSEINFIGDVGYDPRADYTFQIDIEDGTLEPDTHYYFRFLHGKHESILGETRTLPAPDDERPVSIAVTTCREFTTGYFNVDKVLLSFIKKGVCQWVFHNGDAIYEYGGEDGYDSDSAPRRRVMSLPSGGKSAKTYEDFSHIYQTYYSDEAYKKLRAIAPHFYNPDDHEVADNYHYDRRSKAPGIPGTRYKGLTPDEKKRLVLNARKAWVNYVPAKVKVNRDTEDPNQFVQLHRMVKLGKQADLLLLDERSFRDGSRIADEDINKTMLGKEQLKWFKKTMKNSKANWRLVGNAVMFSRFSVFDSHMGLIPDILVNSDQWNGFIHERGVIKDFIQDNDFNNVVFLTGDMHTSLVSYVQPFDEPDSSEHVALELMTPSLTSPNLKTEMGVLGGFDKLIEIMESYIQDQNHHLQHFNGHIHGFAVLTLETDRIQWDVYEVPVDEDLENPSYELVFSGTYNRDRIFRIIEEVK